MKQSFVSCLAAAFALAALAPAAPAADPCPNAEIRQQQGTTRLPECRAYEMVSPPSKNGNAVLGGIAPRADGNAFAFWSPGAFSGALSSVGVVYVARRGAGGWTTTAIIPPLSGRNPSLIDAVDVLGFDNDFSRALMETQYPLDPADVATGVREDLYLREPDGSLEWVTGGATIPGGVQGRAAFAGASNDLDHVVFEAERSYDPAIPESPTVEHVYERHNGQVRLVNRDTNGDPMLDGAQVGTGMVVSDPFANLSTAVSSDGSRIAFSSPPDTVTGQVYVRINGTTTVQASATQKDPPDVDPPRGSIYRDATPDTSKILFSSADSLTDDSLRGPEFFNQTLYLYDVKTGELKNVSPYDNPSAPPDEQAAGPSVVDTAGMSDDGSRIFFVATGRLIDDPRPVNGERNLYMYDAATDSVRWLGIVDFNEANQRRNARVTPDGENLLVQSTRALDGGSQTGDQLYRYDVSEDDWTCVSCTAHGSGLGTDPFDGIEYRTYGIPQGRISADGRRVFFDTSVALLPEDNNTVHDPYVWVDGQLHLLSSGRSPHPSVWVGSTPDGSEAFILTNESLTGHDVDNGVADAYAVRVNGGFAEPETAQTCTTDCRPEPSPPPARQEPGSATFQGSDGPALAPRASFSVARLGRAQRARLARGRKVALRVRVNRAGRVALTARARLGGRLVVVGRDSVRAARAGTVQLELRLSKAARRRLARGRALRVTVSVAFAGVREPERLSLRLAR